MIGSIAAILTTFAFLPQVVRVVKTKDTESIALGMYVMQVIGIALWLYTDLAKQIFTHPTMAENLNDLFAI